MTQIFVHLFFLRVVGGWRAFKTLVRMLWRCGLSMRGFGEQRNRRKLKHVFVFWPIQKSILYGRKLARMGLPRVATGSDSVQMKRDILSKPLGHLPGPNAFKQKKENRNGKSENHVFSYIIPSLLSPWAGAMHPSLVSPNRGYGISIPGWIA